MLPSKIAHRGRSLCWPRARQMGSGVRSLTPQTLPTIPSCFSQSSLSSGRALCEVSSSSRRRFFLGLCLYGLRCHSFLCRNPISIRTYHCPVFQFISAQPSRCTPQSPHSQLEGPHPWGFLIGRQSCTRTSRRSSRSRASGEWPCVAYIGDLSTDRVRSSPECCCEAATRT